MAIPDEPKYHSYKPRLPRYGRNTMLETTVSPIVGRLPWARSTYTISWHMTIRGARRTDESTTPGA